LLRLRSERRLCEEVHLNLAYRWFCRLGLEGDVPDHSTFSKSRHGRFRENDLLRELFEATVQRCIPEGLVGGEGFAVDASLIRADANKQRSAEASELVDWDDLARTRRSVREYLDTLDEAGWGAASEAKPKFVSRSDPAAQWTGAMKGHAFFAYASNYLIDLDHAVIVDVEASRAIRQAEVGSARTMLDRTQERFGLWPARLAADSAARGSRPPPDGCVLSGGGPWKKGRHPRGSRPSRSRGDTPKASRGTERPGSGGRMPKRSATAGVIWGMQKRSQCANWPLNPCSVRGPAD
jgi:IS5 family transposase